MRFSAAIAAAPLLVLAACGGAGDGPANGTQPANATGKAAAPPAPAALGRPAGRWALQSSGEGVALALPAASGATAIRLFCPAGGNQLLVNVPAFRPIGSEERLSFGSGGEAVALVADPRGDARRGGVSAAGAVPGNLAALIAGSLSASYGAQTSGPHAPPPPDVARRFVAACRERPFAPPAVPPAAPSAGAAPAGACMMQGSERLRVAPLRAVGTEPFWGARIEGRCVTYSHPEDQAGTRVWTRYAPGPGGGGTWSGALGGRPFELRARPRPGCSDGMSDTSYPIAVDLLVGGERRHGCAAPL
ncbi:MAG: hypothetical protein QOI38_1063 [Sphingomonadales bacterium]|jgi:uncharacterized membrane protein|nr:hypothetical protein [Sphingomonadales bacterium]